MIAAGSANRGSQGSAPMWLLALCLSIGLWVFVKMTQTPFSSTITQADLQVQLEVLKDDQAAALGAPESIRITVRGSEDAIKNLKSGAVSAWIDLRGLAEGLYLPSIRVSQPPELSIVSFDPESASVRLDPVVTVHLPVTPKLDGHTAKGYTTAPPVLRSTAVDVSGPKTYVDQVKSVVAHVALSNTETGIMQKVLLEPVDGDGNPVTNVQLSPQSEIVTVNVTPAIVPHLLPVFPQLVGQLPGTLAIDASWTPHIVPVVFGQDEKNPTTSVQTEPIDVRNLRPGDRRFQVKVVAPPGATLAKDDEITVTLHVHPKKAAAENP